MAEQWHNRISGYGEESPDTLLANPRNFRRHPKHQQDALAGVLRDVGVVQNVIVNRTTGLVVDGHARIALAIRDGQTTIPITYVELSEAEESLVLATLDPIAALATIDAEILENLLRDVTTGDAAVQAMLDALAVDAGIVPGLGEPGDGGDDFDTTPDDGPTRVQRGELWQLGNHRLLCGDSTNADDVARLMGGERAGAVVTDSPYGINRDGIENDNPEGLRALFDRLLLALPCDDAVMINCQSPRLFPAWIDALRNCGHKFERALWYVETGSNSYPWRGWMMKGQIILVSSIGKGAWPKDPPIVRDTYSINFLAQNLGELERQHTTIKPIELIQSLVEHTMGNIYDPFLGSGTTIIAAERTGRRCYGMEIEPKYCDVIIRRWEAETGRSAEKAG